MLLFKLFICCFIAINLVINVDGGDSFLMPGPSNWTRQPGLNGWIMKVIFDAIERIAVRDDSNVL